MRSDRVVSGDRRGGSPPRWRSASLFSYLDSRHEDALAPEALAKRLPDVPVTVSSAVAREFREYPRTATAALNAGLRPVVRQPTSRSYGRGRLRLGARCAAADHAVQRRVPARRARRRRGDAPAGALRPRGGRRGSGGPGRRATACAYWCPSTWAGPRWMCAWSATACRRSRPPSWSGDDPILCPSVDIVTAGAGGGSIAWVDRACRTADRPAERRRVPRPGRVRAGRRPLHRHRRARGGGHAVRRTRRSAAGSSVDTGAARRAVAETGGQLGLSAERRRGRHRAGGGCADDRGAAPRRSSGASTPASTRRSRSAARGRCTLASLLREAGLGGVLVPRYPGTVRRGRAGLRRPADRRVEHGAAGAGARAAARARVLVPGQAARLTGQLRRDGIRAS